MLKTAISTSWSTPFSRPLSFKLRLNFGRGISFLTPAPQRFRHFVCTQLPCLFFVSVGFFLLVWGGFLSFEWMWFSGQECARSQEGIQRDLSYLLREGMTYSLTERTAFFIQFLNTRSKVCSPPCSSSRLRDANSSEKHIRRDSLLLHTLSCWLGMYLLSVPRTTFSNESVNNAGT